MDWVILAMSNAMIVCGFGFIALVLFHPDPYWPPPRFMSGIVGAAIALMGFGFRKEARRDP